MVRGTKDTRIDDGQLMCRLVRHLMRSNRMTWERAVKQAVQYYGRQELAANAEQGPAFKALVKHVKSTGDFSRRWPIPNRRTQNHG